MPVPRVVDVSHWQKIPADGFQRAARSGIWGIINKVTQSTGQVDPTFALRRPLVKAAGQLYGAYHFMVPGSVKVQAENFLRRAKPDDDLLLALDWEHYRGVAPSAAEAEEWCSYVEQKVGRPVVVYSGNTAKEKLGNRVWPSFARRRLWLAMYANRPICQRSWRTAWLWQYSGDGRGPLPHSVPGLGVNIDMNDYVLDDHVPDPDVARENLRREWAAAPTPADQKPNDPQDVVGSHNVKWMQEQLNALGAQPPLKLDGDYGPRTHDAVREFQIAHPPLKPDGLFGPATSAMLDAVLLSRSEESLRGEETPEVVSGPGED